MAGYEWKLTVQFHRESNEYVSDVYSRIVTGAEYTGWLHRAHLVTERPAKGLKPEAEFAEILRRLMP